MDNSRIKLQHLRGLLAGMGALGVLALLVQALLERPAPVEDLAQRVAEALPRSGVEHPVTAVLLNFRGYDTLLEIGVLFIAVVVALALRDAQPDRPEAMGLDNPLLRAVMGWLLPMILITAGFLLWAGADRPGGAFQAGAVLAGAGVLLRLAGVVIPGLSRQRVLRSGLALGLLVFLSVALGVGLGERAFLAYPEAYAGAFILLIELALTLSIGLSLLSLFMLAPPYSDDPAEIRPAAHPGKGPES